MMTEPMAARARNGASEPELPQRKIRSWHRIPGGRWTGAFGGARC